MKNRDENAFYIQVANAILDMGTIDIGEIDQNPKQYPVIDYLIAEHLLQDGTGYELERNIERKKRKVENTKYDAIKYIEDERNIKVYRFNGKKKGAIECITIDPEYKSAKEKNIHREKNNYISDSRRFKRNIQVRAPEIFKQFRAPVQRVLNFMNK